LVDNPLGTLFGGLPLGDPLGRHLREPLGTLLWASLRGPLGATLGDPPCGTHWGTPLGDPPWGDQPVGPLLGDPLL
jgi:hypothetical protein